MADFDIIHEGYAARPSVSVQTVQDAAESHAVELPAVFKAPIRNDIVHFVHTQMAKNKRQAYAVNFDAGHQTSAESWGTGRAVSRIPRVCGGGTHRAGQAAFGNMCRGGRMFAPTRIWRRWHRKINVNQRRYATVSAIAASAVPALVMARGHKIDNVPEIPLVVSNDIESIKKTKQAVAFLKKIGAYDDVQRVKDSKTLRCGVGKSRNRRFTQRVGPLVVFNGDEGIQRAFRNIPGVDLCHVSRLNLLQLAPGSHLGRFIIWSASAFEELNTIYGTEERNSSIKSGYVLPRHSMTSSDLARVINSDAVQSVIRPAIFETSGVQLKKKNALKNREVMLELNPYFAETRKREAERIAAGRKKVAKTNRDAASKAEGKKYWEMMMGEGPSSSEEEESEEEEESDE
jgi:large subunit ribosomal protein L4e